MSGTAPGGLRQQLVTFPLPFAPRHGAVSTAAAPSYGWTRADAESVLHQMKGLCRAPGPWSSRRYAGHRLFGDLCAITTEHWLRYAPRSEDPELVYAVVVNFHRNYRESVLVPLASPHRDCPRHWRRHLESAEAFGRTGRWVDGARTLFWGTYAHTRFDLAGAVGGALAVRYPDELGVVDAARAYRTLLGADTDGVFAAAASEFLQRWSPARVVRAAGGAHREPVPPAGRVDGRRAGCSWLWMPAFQRWRRCAWREALVGRAAARRGRRRRVAIPC